MPLTCEYPNCEKDASHQAGKKKTLLCDEHMDLFKFFQLIKG